MPVARAMIVALFALAACALAQPSSVSFERTPNGGIQPRAAVDAAGATHLIYFTGEPGAGNLHYVMRPERGAAWSEPKRVNSVEGAAVAAGGMRGGRIAVGDDGTVHVAWNGSAAVAGGSHQSPVLYARLRPGADAFEEQRNLMTRSGVLDGGCDVAAAPGGRVYVAWHGVPDSSEERGEQARRVMVAASDDSGASFAPEVIWSDAANGACGCCGLSIGTESSGEPVVLYRTARDGVGRGMHLVRAPDGGATRDSALDRWRLDTCPASSASIAPNARALAWESEQGVSWTGPGRDRAAVAGPKPAKHPVVSTDAEGRTLVAWIETRGWGNPGAVRWAIDGVRGEADRAPSVPEWGLVEVIAAPDGGFVILH